MFSCELCEIFKNTSGRMLLEVWKYFSLSKKITGIEISHWELFCKKGVLRCVFAWENEVFWTGQSQGKPGKLSALLKFSLFAWDVDLFWIIKMQSSRGVLSRVWPEGYNFIKKETLAQVFSSEFWEISKNTFLKRTPLVAASNYNLESKLKALWQN